MEELERIMGEYVETLTGPGLTEALLAWKNRALREFAATAEARIMAADPGSDNRAESYGLNKSLDVIDAALAEAVAAS